MGLRIWPRRSRGITGGGGLISPPPKPADPEEEEMDPRLRMNYYSDIPGGGALFNAAPFSTSALAAGTNVATSEKDHPGVSAISSSTSANSGYMVWTGQFAGLLLSGSEHFSFVFKQARFTDVVHLAGFVDMITAVPPVDGVFFSVDASGNLTGKTSNNSSVSTTGTSYALSLGTWYRGEIYLNADATKANFYLFDCATGAQLWTDELSANIPTAAGRETGAGWVIYHTGTAIFELGSLDFIQAEVRRNLIR